MLYERELMIPPAGWGVHMDSFFYCETFNQGKISNFYSVTLRDIIGDVMVQKFKLATPE